MAKSGTPRVVELGLEQAQTAWDSGRPTFILKYSNYKGFDERQLNDLLDGVLALGWRLAHFSTHLNTIALNVEVAVAVFERPA